MKTVIGIVVVLGFVGIGIWFSGDLLLQKPVISPQLAADSAQQTVIRALGFIEPVSELRRLTFRLDGVISSCPIEIGQRVKKDDLLMTLKNLEEQAAVELAQQELAVVVAERALLLAGAPADQIAGAERHVELMKEYARHAQIHYERTKVLAERKASSQSDYDQAETDLLRASKRVQQSESELAHLKNIVRPEDKLVADAKVKRAEAQLRVTKERLSDTILLAPFDGTVLEILRREGEGARQSDRDAAIVFADDSQLRVRAEVDERFVSVLTVGQRAIVYGRGLGSKRTEGKIALIKGVMGPKTVFSREASERKDLDIIQVLIDLPAEFHAPLGLQVDVDLLPLPTID